MGWARLLRYPPGVILAFQFVELVARGRASWVGRCSECSECAAGKGEGMGSTYVLKQ